MISKKVIIITGTRKGIGRDIAIHYAKAGHVVIGCSRGDSSIDIPGYEHYKIDITDETLVKQFFRELRKKHGKLDILINNAGVNNALSPATLVSFQAAESTIKTNFIGTFLMSRESVKLMMKFSFGRIINFGSMAVKHEERGEAIYTASKAAIIAFTKIFSKEIYQYGITCNVVSPSAIDTDLMSNIDKDALLNVLKRNAIPEVGQVNELISVLNWLIEDSSAKITGQNIYLGGV